MAIKESETGLIPRTRLIAAESKRDTAPVTARTNFEYFNDEAEASIIKAISIIPIGTDMLL